MCSRCGAKKLFWERGYVHKVPASPRICYWCWHLHSAAATLRSSLLGFSAAELFVSLSRHLSLPSVCLCVSPSLCLSHLSVCMCLSLCRSLYPALSFTLFVPWQSLCRDPAALWGLWNVSLSCHQEHFSKCSRQSVSVSWSSQGLGEVLGGPGPLTHTKSAAPHSLPLIQV